jgi:HSP20 family protein
VETICRGRNSPSRPTNSGYTFETEAGASDVAYLMDSTRTIRLRWLHSSVQGVTPHLAGLRLSRAGAHLWRPAINAYRCEACIRVCVDLAGVDRSDIDLTIAAQRLSIRGVRDVPEPSSEEESRALQMIAMEIDYGPFEREVRLPDEVDVKKVHAEQKNGLLWIYLPLRKS